MNIEEASFDCEGGILNILINHSLLQQCASDLNWDLISSAPLKVI